MQLFTLPKIPLYCDAVNHRLETRRDREIKVVDLKLRVQPFTAQHASGLDADLAFVKKVLFRTTDGAAVAHYKNIEFKPPTGDRQLLTVFASSDTVKPTIAFDQAKIRKMFVRTEKGVDGWALILRLTFGPVDKAELEYVNAWYTEQRFVSFQEAEPSLDFDETPPAKPRSKPATPMFETDAAGQPNDQTH
jgi:hypothetical protein